MLIEQINKWAHKYQLQLLQIPIGSQESHQLTGLSSCPELTVTAGEQLRLWKAHPKAQGQGGDSGRGPGEGEAWSIVKKLQQVASEK